MLEAEEYAGQVDIDFPTLTANIELVNVAWCDDPGTVAKYVQLARARQPPGYRICQAGVIGSIECARKAKKVLALWKLDTQLPTHQCAVAVWKQPRNPLQRARSVAHQQPLIAAHQSRYDLARALLGSGRHLPFVGIQ